MIHKKHMEMVDAVNNSKTQQVHDMNLLRLSGWLEGVRDAGKRVDLIAADLEQFKRGFEKRPMCCGVFSDWKPEP